MVVVPPDMPVIKPVLILIFAIAGSKLVHVPPGIASVRDDVPPIHTARIPVIAGGLELTVTNTVV